jgi:hypothetical protein
VEPKTPRLRCIAHIKRRSDRGENQSMEKVAVLCVLMAIISLCADWSPGERKRPEAGARSRD